MAELDAESAAAHPREALPYSEVGKGYTVFRDGDLLLAKITPCWENGKIGQASLDREIGVGSTEFHVVRPAPQVDARYLMRFLRTESVRATGELRMTGSGGQRRVPVKYLQSLEVPLPPLGEQRRIAAILDHADALRAKRRQVLAHLDDLTQSIFHETFGEDAGEQVPLGELVTSIDNGKSPNCETRPAEDDEWGVLKLGAVTYGTFDEGENKAFLGDLGSMAKNEVRPGDVLMTRKNTRELVGAVAVVGEGVRERLLLPDLIFRLRLDPQKLMPRYFHALMSLPGTRAAVRHLSSGSAASMPNISKARLRDLQLPVPSLRRQEQFTAAAAAVEAVRTEQVVSLVVADELFASLQSRAFTGEL